MVELVLPNSVGWQSPNPKINLLGILMDKGGDIGASGRVSGISPCPLLRDRAGKFGNLEDK